MNSENPEQEVDEILRLIDTNNSGTINYSGNDRIGK